MMPKTATKGRVWSAEAKARAAARRAEREKGETKVSDLIDSLDSSQSSEPAAVIRTIAEQTAPSSRGRIPLPSSLKTFGSDVFPAKHPDLECIQVPKKEGLEGLKYGFVSGINAMKGLGYKELEFNIDEDMDGRDDLVWMGKPKKDIIAENKLRNPVQLGSSEKNRDDRELLMEGVTQTSSKALRIGDMSLEEEIPTAQSLAQERAQRGQFLKDHPEADKILDSLVDSMVGE